jgi:hypothetical protein
VPGAAFAQRVGARPGVIVGTLVHPGTSDTARAADIVVIGIDPLVGVVGLRNRTMIGFIGIRPSNPNIRRLRLLTARSRRKRKRKAGARRGAAGDSGKERAAA